MKYIKIYENFNDTEIIKNNILDIFYEFVDIDVKISFKNSVDYYSNEKVEISNISISHKLAENTFPSPFIIDDDFYDRFIQLISYIEDIGFKFIIKELYAINSYQTDYDYFINKLDLHMKNKIMFSINIELMRYI